MKNASGPLILALIAWAPALGAQRALNPSGYVSFCEIVQYPDRYDQKIVLTSGIYTAGPEFSDFVDVSCPTTPERDVGTLPVPIRERVQGTREWRRLREVLEKDKRAFIVVRGVFDAFNRYEGPLPDDPRLQEVLKKGNSRFGHLNFARFRLRIESVEFVAPVGRE
jgi:hypothetical protein